MINTIITHTNVIRFLGLGFMLFLVGCKYPIIVKQVNLRDEHFKLNSDKPTSDTDTTLIGKYYGLYRGPSVVDTINFQFLQNNRMSFYYSNNQDSKTYKSKEFIGFYNIKNKNRIFIEFYNPYDRSFIYWKGKVEDGTIVINFERPRGFIVSENPKIYLQKSQSQ